MSQETINQIYLELCSLEPSFGEHEEQVKQLIQEMVTLRPSVEPTPTFVLELQEKLADTIAVKKQKRSLWQSFVVNKPLAVSLSTILIISVLGIGGYEFKKENDIRVAQNQKQATDSTNTTTAVGTSDSTAQTAPGNVEEKPGDNTTQNQTIPSATTSEYAYKTDKGTPLKMSVIVPESSKWKQVAFEMSRKASRIVTRVMAADPVLNLSGNFDTNDSFQTMSAGGGKFLLAGGNNFKRTLFTTDWGTFEDYSQKLPTMQNTIISASDYGENKWIFGTNTSGDHRGAWIFSFDGKEVQDLTSTIYPGVDVKHIPNINTIKFNGGEWLIMDSNYKLIRYKDGVATQLQSRLAAQTPSNSPYFYQTEATAYAPAATHDSRVFRSAAYNGQYWLLSGYYFSNETKHNVPLLYKLEGDTFTDLSSNIKNQAIASELFTVFWDGKKFYIGGMDPNVGGNGQAKHPLFYSYDGTSFTNLSDQLDMIIVKAIDQNDRGEILIGGNNISSSVLYLLRNGVFEKVPLVSKDADGNEIRSLVHDKNLFYAGGWAGSIVSIQTGTSGN